MSTHSSSKSSSPAVYASPLRSRSVRSPDATTTTTTTRTPAATTIGPVSTPSRTLPPTPTTTTTTPYAPSLGSATSSPKSRSKDAATTTVLQWRQQLQTLQRRVKRIPPRYKVLLVIFWIGWKVLVAALVLYLFQSHTDHLSFSSIFWNHVGFGESLDSSSSSSRGSSSSSLPAPVRVLYIITSLAEYNTGKRDTIKGQDRLAQVLLPVLVDSLHTFQQQQPPQQSQQLQQQNVHVDVYLILAYQLRPEREMWLRSLLEPLNVGVQIWDDALPLGYDPPLSRSSSVDTSSSSSRPITIQPNTRALARQHRYVIKDKLPYYDVFLALEDDMRVTAEQVQHFVKMSLALEQLRRQHAAATTTNDETASSSSSTALFFGDRMPAAQLDRLLPGFIRVEVLLNETQHGAQTVLDPVPLDYDYTTTTTTTTTTTERHFDPTTCCHVPHMVEQFPDMLNPPPAHPTQDQVVIWETTVKALAVRQLPALDTATSNNNNNNNNNYLDWVALLPGPGKRLEEPDKVVGYWSGQDGAFGKDAVRPTGGDPRILAQQGGWIATQTQIYRLHQGGICQDAFLPPYNAPVYRSDGQDSMNVEYWSGGYQLFTGVLGGCNMQRIVSLHPDFFSKHFLYHVANNKQRTLAQNRMLRADHLWGQLNSVRKAAERTKAAMLQHP